MSMPSDPTSSTAVFHITELIMLICNCLNARECTPLLAINSVCFPVVASRVWEHVNDARVLLRLIRAHRPRFDGLIRRPIISLEGGNLRRFDVYAPFVKHLNVYGNEDKHFRVAAWYVLFRRARERPLLPNLQSLTMNATDSPFAIDQVLWTSALACPSLTRFTPVYVQRFSKFLVSDMAASIILKTLSERSPNIQSLALYRQVKNGPGEEDGESCIFNLVWDGSFLTHLQSLVNLHQLSVTLSMIDGPGLKTIGNLPRLENLAIYGCFDSLDNRDFLISDDSFLRLTHLKLWDLYLGVVEDLMATVPLVKNLTNLTVHHCFEEEREDEQMLWFEESLALLFRHTHCLEHLYYDATSAPELLQLQPFAKHISSNFMRRTSELKLKSMTLVGFEYWMAAVIQAIPICWSGLTSLRIGSPCPGGPVMLPYLGLLPHLQILSLPLGLVDIPPLVFKTPDPAPALHTLVALDGTTKGEPRSHVATIARFFQSLWPNLRTLHWPAVESGEPTDPSLLPLRHFLQSINELFRTSPSSITQLADIVMAEPS